jgi:uncharacterized protein (TIGR02679 family)
VGLGDVDVERVRRLLGGDHTRWLVERARDRLERGHGVEGIVALPEPSTAQRRAVEQLLGRRPRAGHTLRVPLGEVDRVLRSSGAAPSLSDAVAALTGPLRDRVAEAADEARGWNDAWALTDELVAAHPDLDAWRAEMRDTGLLRRLAGDPTTAARLLADAVRVLRRLPGKGQPLSVLAAEACGDGHALDADRALSTVVLRAVCRLAAVPRGAGAEWRREAWAGVRVLVGDLAGPVLTLGLPGEQRTATGRVLALWRDAGQPVHLSLRQLVQAPPDLDLDGESVFVCENPSIVAAAADRLGADCASLVCVGGHPGAAANTLLRLLCAAGGSLRYHGDFDWGGVTIGNGVLSRFGAVPWHYGAREYRRAPKGAPLTGAPVDARWDPDLRAAMEQHGRRVEEELVLDELLADLGR